ncbi:MAG: hypothetical protein A2043_02735 [Candidatus Schekmanbacteria bacterium GWA2_38_9]|uniref:DUF86 domain-containing protein n=1 Tax=Candidatus Schekmanbacteria bacterium RIFCSPLOWO2_12_FULL_38_15 TaxID=1817883 RepID=A0A1F7SK72_9BACT|nr:MAG: hypothetical protein A2043_02735 [Candidatus Schekmanbacteria bacterium GWA2_38_9]OGL54159.1 MAG: hypothetical protein A3G31_05195 [Candidatus Schekmanbacteria bacterium RIFCSPLOWO2_12_FULL_38_15]
MRRSFLLYLEDILESVNSILNYTGNLSFDELIIDKMRLDAIVRNFEIIGEASGKIPQDIKDKYSFIEWRKISDFRNVLAHEYFGIDYEIMWEIIKNKLPDLQKDTKSILEKEQ